ncbi:MAG TPA: elongation factor P [bacterium]
MISTNDFRAGVVVELDGDLYAVVQSQHVKRGRGSAYVRAKVRNLKTGATTERTFNAGERVPLVYLDRVPMQYLYSQNDQYYVMDQASYEQIALPGALLGDAVNYLKDNTDVTVVLYDGKPIAVELPNAVELAVVDTAPSARGDTVSGSTKPAHLETGLVVQVPFFVQTGDRIRIDTRTGDYLERVK